MPVTLKEAFEILSQRKACTQLEILKEIVNESLELIKDSAHNRRLGNNFFNSNFFQILSFLIEILLKNLK